MATKSDSHKARGRIGGLTTAARHDTRKTSKPGRDKFLASFEDQVDPERVLPEAERQRRADAARKAHMARLAQKSVEARRKKAGKWNEWDPEIED